MPVIEYPAAQGLSPARAYEAFGKRILDLSLVTLTLPVTLPLIVLLLALTAAMGGKPLYAQERVGQGGRRFRCWKVRTMVRDADARLARVLAEDPAAAAEWATKQKLTRDPRITPLGRILRRTSLDELPQLWNVVTGSMSLVGPRPFTPDQQDLYDSGKTGLAYYRLRPGLTGPWQVSRRNAGGFSERRHFDEVYGEVVSLRADLTLIAQTFRVVLRASGI